MSEYSLKDAIDEHLPSIDEMFQEAKIPIFQRFMRAAIAFVRIAIIESSVGTEEELLRSKAFYEVIVPLVNDWYWEKYGDLAKDPTNKILAGIITPYGQPLLIKIPCTTKKIEVPGETIWLKFPDCLQEGESLASMAQTKFSIDTLPVVERHKLQSEFSEIVSMTRSINLDIMVATELDNEIRDMASGIWSHFEKAINDILSFRNQQASIGCWELHLAIEKTLKVYLKQASGKKHYGHNLNDLANKARGHLPDIELTIIDSLPSDKDAIQLRYAELIKSVDDATNYYKSALVLVSTLTKNIKRKISLNNASFLLKAAPWAR